MLEAVSRAQPDLRGRSRCGAVFIWRTRQQIPRLAQEVATCHVIQQRRTQRIRENPAGVVDGLAPGYCVSDFKRTRMIYPDETMLYAPVELAHLLGGYTGIRYENPPTVLRNHH